MLQPVAPETVALLRRRYADGVPVASIQAETGVRSADRFYKCIDGHYADGSGAPLPLPALARRRGGAAATLDTARRRSLVARIWESAEQQVGVIETRLAGSGLTPDAFERDARSLAVVARTLRELTALAAAKRAREKQSKSPHDNKPVPRNLDELRRELARKLEAIAQEVPRGGEGGDLRTPRV